MRTLSLRRRLIAVSLTVLALMVTGCGESVVLPDDADAELISGFDIYRARCATCHGQTGGGGLGKPLVAIEDRLSEEEQQTVISEGRNRMPRFDGILSDSDIKAVIRFTREIF